MAGFDFFKFFFETFGFEPGPAVFFGPAVAVPRLATRDANLKIRFLRRILGAAELGPKDQKPATIFIATTAWLTEVAVNST